MQTRNIRLRIARLEQTANVHRKHEHDCVCFPEREPPFFCSPWEEELAAKVKCPYTVIASERLRFTSTLLNGAGRASRFAVND
jgi:hypothetical protein